MEETIIFPAAINANFNNHNNCYQYRLIIYNSKFSRVLVNKKERARLVKKEDEFFLIKDSSGNILNPSPEHQTIFMSVGKIYPEIKNCFPLKNQKKSNTLKIKIKLNPNEWKLDKLDVFLESKEERALAGKLIKLGYKVEPITYNDKDKFEHACADLILYHNKDKIPIEITTIAPSETRALSGVNSPHGHQWNKVSGRITPLIVYSIENNLKSFMIINQKWKKYPHVKDLIDRLKSLDCYTLFSDFSDKWDENLANQINEVLCKKK